MNDKNQPDTKNNKKAYKKPETISEEMFEAKALACDKLATGGGDDCDLNFGPGSNENS